MPDTPDLTPPPEQSMPDPARASIRRQLAAATAGDDIGHGSRGVAVRWGRWTTPAIAAAAVIAVVLGAFAVAATQDNSSEPGPDSLQPAATSTGSVPPTTAPPETTPPTAPPETTPPTPPPPTSTPGEQPFVTTNPALQPPSPPPPSAVPPGLPELPDKSVTCDEEVREFARFESVLRGASVTAERETAIGTIYLYETETAWVVCDDSTAIPGGPQSQRGYTPTLISFHQKSVDYPKNTRDISQNYIAGPDGAYAYFVAAGRDFDGVAISYKFPDGHTEEAVVGENGLWSMAYAPTEGVLADPKTDIFQLDPIKVTVQWSFDDYSVEFLEWGLDTCAQLNHGC